MSHVFISYSTKNYDYALKLADKLQLEGFDVWIDNERLRVSENWWKSIVLAIWGCAAFIVILTPESDDSEYVQREIAIADSQKKPIFPLLLAGDLNTVNWQFFIRTQYQNVLDGNLPPAEFYEALARVTPRSSKGSNVTRIQASSRTDEHNTELAAEIANPPTDYPSQVTDIPSLQDEPVNIPVTSIQNRRWLLFVGLTLFVIFIGWFALNSQPPLPKSPTLTQSVLNVSNTRTNTPTLTPTKTITPSLTPTSTPSLTVTPSLTLRPSITPTLDIQMAIASLDAEATISINQTNTAIASTEEAIHIATINSYTDTPIPTITLTPNATTTIQAFLAQRVALTATATLWTPTPIPTPVGGRPGQIAFSLSGGIYVIDIDGNNLRRITDSSYDASSPSWSSDGSKIVFASYRDGNGEIYSINTDGSNLQRLTNNQIDDSSPSWSPNGTKIVFISGLTGNYEIHMMDSNGSNVVQLTNDKKSHSSPVWSKNGRIAFSVSDYTNEIFLMNTDTSGRRQIGEKRNYNYNPVWSPNGGQLAFVSEHPSYVFNDNSAIFVINADGSNLRQLTSDFYDEYHSISLTWSPDGTQIAFVGRGRQLSIINVDGSNLREISNIPAGMREITWRPAAPSPDPLLGLPTAIPTAT